MGKLLSIIIVLVILVFGGSFLLKDHNREGSFEAMTEGQTAGRENEVIQRENLSSDREVLDGKKEERVPENTIIIEDYAFSPAFLTIKKGTTVTWINRDLASHTVTTIGENGPKSKLLRQNESYSYTFDTASDTSYYCEPHPYMKAAIKIIE